ncbi:MAG: hypothetical protein AAF388_05135 [Bacteroidota bacterium]
MKSVIKSFVLGIICLSFTGLMAQESSTPPLFELSYMKTKSSDYLTVETEYWKKIHQSRIEAGELSAWYLYEVVYPSGTQTDYNYITLNVYGAAADMLKMTNENLMAHLEKALPGMAPEEVFDATGASRDLVKTEAFSLLDRFPQGATGKATEFLMANYMDVAPGKEQEYVAMEKEVFKKGHAARINAGQMDSWFLGVRQFPYGTDFGPAFMTVDGYGSFENIFKSPSEEMMNEAMGAGFDMDRAFDDMDRLREVKRAELWKLVDFVIAEEL